MRFVIVAGALVLAAGVAAASYLVGLDEGEMTVDSYWVDGDRIHLVKDGVALNLLRSRVRSLRSLDAHRGGARGPRATRTGTPERD
jgi:hypothetical protein